MSKKQILGLLSDFISIQSVSADPKRQGEIMKAVGFLAKQLKSLGCVVQILKKNDAPPLIIATLNISKGVYPSYAGLSRLAGSK